MSYYKQNEYVYIWSDKKKAYLFFDLLTFVVRQLPRHPRPLFYPYFPHYIPVTIELQNMAKMFLLFIHLHQNKIFDICLPMHTETISSCVWITWESHWYHTVGLSHRWNMQNNYNTNTVLTATTKFDNIFSEFSFHNNTTFWSLYIYI